MFGAVFLGASAFALLLFCLFVAEELNLRHHHPTLVESWFPPFVPLFALVLVKLVSIIALGGLEWRRRPLHRRSVAADLAVDTVFTVLTLVFLVTLVVALNRADDESAAHPWAAFIFCELLLYAAFLLFIVITVVGAVATAVESRSAVDGCWFWLCRRYSPTFAKTREQVADSERDRNTTSVVARRDLYQRRQPYQRNKLVYFFAADLLPQPVVDWLHILTLVGYVGAALLSTILVFVRLRQIGTLAALLTTDPATGLASTTTARLVQWALPSAGELREHVILSLADWRGSVLPLGLALLPIGIFNLFLAVLAIIQAGVYCVHKRPLFDWIEGVAYFVFLVMTIVFVSLLSARVDRGVLEDASWHNTFAPMYTGLIVALLASVVALFDTSKRDPQAPESRWIPVEN